MKITELATLPASPAPVLWNVEVDGECFTPPPGLETIGLVWQGDAPDTISDALIDTIIAFGLSGVEVILEVRPDQKVDPDYVLTVAGNAGFSVAAVPPEDAAGLNAWGEQCAGFAKALLTTPNFSKTLFPATGYLSYLIAENFAGAERLDPTDAYTVGRFVDAAPVEWSDACKQRMKAAMADQLGGEDALRDFLSALIRGLYDEAEKYINEAARDMTEA